jgi:RNA polymerase-binding transcription factor DksA
MAAHQKLRQQLIERLARIVNRAERIGSDLRRTPDPDWEEAAADLQNDEVLEGLDDLALAEVAEIRAALRRIEGGQYGFCAACGRPIAAERLAALPTASTCIWCAA